MVNSWKRQTLRFGGAVKVGAADDEAVDVLVVDRIDDIGR